MPRGVDLAAKSGQGSDDMMLQPPLEDAGAPRGILRIDLTGLDQHTGGQPSIQTEVTMVDDRLESEACCEVAHEVMDSIQFIR